MITRRAFLLGLAACAAPMAPVLAASRRSSIQCALIANFACAKCAALDPMMRSFESSLGQKLHFVPVADREDDYIARGWYALRDEVKDPTALRGALYSLTQKMKLPDPSVDDLVEFLQLEGIEIPTVEMRNRIKAESSLALLLKGVNLAAQAGVEYTPSVVFTQGQTILKMIENQNMSEAVFMSTVLSAKKDLKA